MAQIIKDKKSNTWTIKAKIKLTKDNKFHPLTRRGYSSKTEAQIDLQNQIDEYIRKNDNVLSNNTDSLEDCITEYLDHEKNKKRGSTVLAIKSKINVYINDYFKNNGLTTIKKSMTPINLQEWRESILECDLVPSTKNKILGIMKSFISRLCDRNIITKQYYSDIMQYTESIKDEYNPSEVKYFTPDQFKRFIATFKDDDKYKVYFYIFYYSGVRIGELMGLKWKDYLTATHEIEIKGQRIYLANGKLNETVPKSKKGFRKILISSQLINVLDNYKKYTCECEDQYIVSSSKTAIRKCLSEHIKKYNLNNPEQELPMITPHGFRHSHVSYLISKGLSMSDILILMKRMGHASVEETIATYGHLFPSDQDKLKRLFEEI